VGANFYSSQPTTKEKKTRKEKSSTGARLRNVLIQILHDFYFISFRPSIYVYKTVIETRRSQKRIKSKQPIEYIGSADSIVLFSFFKQIYWLKSWRLIWFFNFKKEETKPNSLAARDSIANFLYVTISCIYYFAFSFSFMSVWRTEANIFRLTPTHLNWTSGAAASRAPVHFDGDPVSMRVYSLPIFFS
jgi:hypothetical protein